jgi:hypothetical protein
VWLALAVLAAAPESARFVLEVSGLPVAELRITVAGDQYAYATTRFFEEGAGTSRKTFSLRALPAPPEVLSLLHRPPPGCREVFEERAEKLEPLCVERGDRGTLAGEPFTATWDGGGRLAQITVGAARWVAVEGSSRVAAVENPFVAGVPAPADRGALRFEPGVEGARWLARPPVASGTSTARARCLVLAREAAQARPGARVAVGLVVEGGRAFPHAWVVDADGQERDPSTPTQPPGRRYVEVPASESGKFYLRLFAGEVKVVAR